MARQQSAAIAEARRQMLQAADAYERAHQQLVRARRILVKAGIRRDYSSSIMRWSVGMWLLDSVDSSIELEESNMVRFLRDDARPGGIEQHIQASIEEQRRERRDVP
jgi:hypothetical protein